jgi:transposase-like protein
MRKGYQQTNEKSIVDDLKRLGRYPENGILSNFSPEQLRQMLNDAFQGTCLDIGVQMMTLFLEEEVNGLCGNRYGHQDGRNRYRYGKQAGYIYAGGQRVPVVKPRVRTTEGEEVRLKTYQAMQNPEAFNESALRYMLQGVSSRRYDRVIEHAAERLSVKKSSISAAFKAMSRRQMQKFAERRFEHEEIVVVLLDGISFGGEMMIGALGINIRGKKLVLGTRQGNTENAQVVADLLLDLKDRGLSAREGLLFVVDGGKALSKSIRDVFGEQAYIQRCRAHKRRNVLDYLSEENSAEFGKAIDEAYALTEHDEAVSELQSVAKSLERVNPDAAASLREGLEETCTVLKFNLPEILLKTLFTTNPIESVFSAVRTCVGRIKRWHGNDMRKRWFVSALLDAEERLNRVKGCKYLPDLKDAMRKDQERRFGKVAGSKEVA